MPFAARPILPLDPRSGITIKREVHEIVVNAPARALVDSLCRVLLAPEPRFGLIRVLFPAGLTGADLRPGVRFQGRYELGLAARELTRAPLLARLCASPPVQTALRHAEDLFMSNYAEITELELDAPIARLKYVYLQGTPIAGSTTYLIEPLAPALCRFTQVFEYQEINRLAHATFGTFGLRQHNRVYYLQVHHAARRLGAEIVSTTLPAAYCELPAAC